MGPHFQFHVQWVATVVDMHFSTFLELVSGGVSIERTGAALEVSAASNTDVAAVCLQLLVELTQRHVAMAKIVCSNTYLLRFLGAAMSKADAESADSAAHASALNVAGEPEGPKQVRTQGSHLAKVSKRKRALARQSRTKVTNE